MIIDIRICTGTTCYVMGASDLLTLEDHIPENLKPYARISGSTCLGLCKNMEHKPPIVQVKGKTISQATVDKVIKSLTAEIEGAEYAYDE